MIVEQNSMTNRPETSNASATQLQEGNEGKERGGGFSVNYWRGGLVSWAWRRPSGRADSTHDGRHLSLPH